MFEDKTVDQLIDESVKLKTELLGIREKRKAIADELRRRDLVKSVSPAQIAMIAKMLQDGRVTVTPPPAVVGTKS